MEARHTANRQITLYSRPGCHLCEDAADLLAQFAQHLPIHVVEINILNHIDLFERYKHRIPIIAIAGGSTLFAPIQADELEQALMA